MLVHADTDSGKVYSCKKCNHSTNTRYNLRQHIRGQHGPGWTTKCGEHFKWAPKMHRHTGKCKKCKAVMDKARKRKLRITTQLEKK